MRTFTAIIFLLSTLLCSAQTTTDAVTTFLNSAPLKHASVGISVIDLNSDSSILSHHAEAALIPASLTKIITTATVLEQLGANYTIKTTIGYTGKLAKGVLQGDIILIGGGDPTTASKYFPNKKGVIDQWVVALKEAGINAVNGGLRLQSDNFSIESVSSRWVWEDMGNYYGSGVYPFSFEDNTYKITYKSNNTGSKATIISQSRTADNLIFDSDVMAANNNKDSAYIYGSPLDKTRYIHGSIPQNRGRFEIKGSVSNPPLALGKEVMIKMRQAGISMSGGISIDQATSSYIQRLKTFESPTLKEIIKVTNHKSINLFADHLLWQLPIQKGEIASMTTGAKSVRQFWNKKGINTGALRLWDGSGLSPQNTVSAAFLTDMLCWINRKSAPQKAFLNSLPIAGVSGSVKRMLRASRLEGQIFMKSGSMDRVRCYAGYVMNNGSPKYAFAILVNHYTGDSKEAIKAIETLMLDLF